MSKANEYPYGKVIKKKKNFVLIFVGELKLFQTVNFDNGDYRIQLDITYQ